MKTWEQKVGEVLKKRAAELTKDESCGDPIDGKSCAMFTAGKLAPIVAAAIDRAVPEYAVRHLENHRRRALKALKGTG